jgi:hypothetical protein
MRLVFIGKQYADGRWTAFFEKDGQVRVASAGMSIDQYRVDAIRDQDVVIVDAQNRQTHIIPTEGGQ